MTEQEQINQNLQRQIDAQTARIDNVLTKVDMLVAESQQQREDIRRAQEKHDADMKAIDTKIDRLGDKIQNMAMTAVVGFGAIAAAVGGIVYAALK